jgi:hypothetical protein
MPLLVNRPTLAMSLVGQTAPYMGLTGDARALRHLLRPRSVEEVAARSLSCSDCVLFHQMRIQVSWHTKSTGFVSAIWSVRPRPHLDTSITDEVPLIP